MTKGFTIFGRLAIYVVRDPVNWRGSISNKEQYLGDFTGPQWESLFYDVLGCPKPDSYIPGEDLDEFNERYRTHFQNHLQQYPMLSRIWDMYNRVNYLPEEVGLLRDECSKVCAGTSNPYAIQGLKNLITGCDEALKLGYGIVLESD